MPNFRPCRPKKLLLPTDSVAPSEGERAGVRGRRAALREIGRCFEADHAVIIPLSVREILDEQIARKLA